MKKLNELTLEEKIGQLFMVGFQDGEDIIKKLSDYKFGNIIYFSRNLNDAKKTVETSISIQKHLINSIGIPALISADQEGGLVSRFSDGATCFNGAMTIAGTNSPAIATEVGRRVGCELLSYGVNMNLAPVLDVNVNEKNPVIGVRAFSDQKEKVCEFGSAFASGLQSVDVLACGKHFPGHGDTHADSHLLMPVITASRERIMELELHPFKSAIARGIDSIMIAHLLVPSIEPEKIPATMSKSIITCILRKQLGFEGLIITDCLEMHAFTQNHSIVKGSLNAILAGANILCISHTPALQIEVYNGLIKAVKDNKLSIELIDERVSRILKYKEKYNLTCSIDKIKLVSEKQLQENNKFVNEVSLASITLVKDRDCLLPISDDDELFAISPIRKPFTSADDNFGLLDFAYECNKSFGCDYYSYMDAGEVSEKDIGNIIKKCKKAKKVIVGSYIASVKPQEKQLLERIIKECKNVIVVALLLPYDARIGEENVSTSICIYEYTKKAIDATFIKLRSNEFTGTLPVNL